MKTIPQTLDLIYLHPHAQIAIRAAKNKKKWGREATRSYVKNNGCPMKLYILAQTLEAIKQWKEKKNENRIPNHDIKR